MVCSLGQKLSSEGRPHVDALLQQLGIDRLSVPERLELISRIWDSIPESESGGPIPEWHRRELERRIAVADADPFRPPAVPTQVSCLHCGQEYDSYLIEWRVEPRADGTPQGFWCCPTPGCDGLGFGFDILPTDPNYQDERGGWVHDDEEDEEREEDCFE
jgi:putative addiction module component (TIGR02574 family)